MFLTMANVAMAPNWGTNSESKHWSFFVLYHPFFSGDTLLSLLGTHQANLLGSTHVIQWYVTCAGSIPIL